MANVGDKFDKVATNWKMMGLHLQEGRISLVAACTGMDAALDPVDRIKASLQELKRKTGVLLEPLRSAFPRFYFADDDDILHAVAYTTSPQLISQRLLEAVFPGLQALKVKLIKGSEIFLEVSCSSILVPAHPLSSFHALPPEITAVPHSLRCVAAPSLGIGIVAFHSSRPSARFHLGPTLPVPLSLPRSPGARPTPCISAPPHRCRAFRRLLLNSCPPSWPLQEPNAEIQGVVGVGGEELELVEPVSVRKDSTLGRVMRSLEEALRSSMREHTHRSLAACAIMKGPEWIASFPLQSTLLVDAIVWTERCAVHVCFPPRPFQEERAISSAWPFSYGRNQPQPHTPPLNACLFFPPCHSVANALKTVTLEGEKSGLRNLVEQSSLRLENMARQVQHAIVRLATQGLSTSLPYPLPSPALQALHASSY